MAKPSGSNERTFIDETRRNRRPRRYGVVVRNSRVKTITVRILTRVRHPKYGKVLKKQLFLHVHDEVDEAQVGDEVEITECRPMSRTKRWRLSRILRRATPQPERNWLIDVLSSDIKEREEPGTAMHYGNAKTKTLRSENTSSRLSGQPIRRPMKSPFPIEEGIAHVSGNLSLDVVDECAMLVANGQADEFFIDIAENGRAADALRLAKALHARIAKRYQLWEPVIVGPLPMSKSSVYEELARMRIRATPLTFSDYCQEIPKLRDSLQKSAKRPLKEKGTSR